MKKARIATLVQLQLFDAIPKFVYLHKRRARSPPFHRGNALQSLAKSARGDGAGEDPVVDNTVKFLQSINFMS